MEGRYKMFDTILDLPKPTIFEIGAEKALDQLRYLSNAVLKGHTRPDMAIRKVIALVGDDQYAALPETTPEVLVQTRGIANAWNFAGTLDEEFAMWLISDALEGRLVGHKIV